jgi:hypothetical protein
VGQHTPRQADLPEPGRSPGPLKGKDGVSDNAMKIREKRKKKKKRKGSLCEEFDHYLKNLGP